MRLATVLLLLTLLSSCATIPRQPETSQDADKLLQEGIVALGEKHSTHLLKQLVKQYPDTPQAKAAAQILKVCLKKKADTNKGEIEKLKQENLQLKEDLDKLRQLLISSEKRAS
ncbi:MAG: hypothetical protein C0624_08025 [Desulfuromonas sp.]|nr:MAG: hypothetical protein C0624_08025 [Desulfuromonas sp.]